MGPTATARNAVSTIPDPSDESARARSTQSYSTRFASALRAWRHSKRMSLRQLAAWLNQRESGRAPAESTIGQWEQGLRLPPAKWLPMLTRAGFVPPPRTPPPVLGFARYA
jgi:DNA-binding transcriptional regulator YiaG